jgi:hypothetical protein
MVEQKQWESVATADNEPVAEMMRQKLEQAGVTVLLKPGDASSYMGASSPYEVLVPPDQADKAKETLSD